VCSTSPNQPPSPMCHQTPCDPKIFPKPTLPAPKVWRALDLFSGSGSVAQVLRNRGWEVVTLDNAKRANADITTDILLWEFWKIPRGYFQLVAAGPPCQEYSQAKTIGVRDMVGADKLVRKTLEIIKHFQPLLWWVENPRGGLLKTRGLLDSFHFVDVDYCQFGDCGYQKPTRVWGSAQLGRLAPRLCNPQCPNKNPHTGRHFQQLGGYGPQLTAWEKGRMPSKLVEYLLSSAPEIGPPRSRSVVW